MTPDMDWSNIENDHVKTISSFDNSKVEELQEVAKWKTRSLYYNSTKELNLISKPIDCSSSKLIKILNQMKRDLTKSNIVEIHCSPL